MRKPRQRAGRPIAIPGFHFDWVGFTELVQLWRDLRGDAALPTHQSMTARRLKDLLPGIALYERFIGPDGNYRHRVRLEGTRFVRIYGTHTGQLVQDFLSPENAARFCAGLDTTLAAMARRYASWLELIPPTPTS